MPKLCEWAVISNDAWKVEGRCNNIRYHEMIHVNIEWYRILWEDTGQSSADLGATWRSHLAKPPGAPGAEPTWPTRWRAHLAHCFDEEEYNVCYIHLAVKSPPGDMATWHLKCHASSYTISWALRLIWNQSARNPPGAPGEKPTWRTCQLDFRSHPTTWPTWRGSPPGVKHTHLANTPPGASTWRMDHLAHLATWQSIKKRRPSMADFATSFKRASCPSHT